MKYEIARDYITNQYLIINIETREIQSAWTDKVVALQVLKDLNRR